jgi:hypothetical protein
MARMPDPVAYLDEIEIALISSEFITAYTIVRNWANTDDGYVRIRATLINGDFLEASEYFVVQGDEIEAVDYRYQWMDGSRSVLRRRWDNTPHHPNLDGFPHHCHVGQESHVIPGRPLSLLQFLSWLEAEIPRV